MGHGEASLPGLQVASFLLYPHLAISLGPLMEREAGQHLFFSVKNTAGTRFGHQSFIYFFTHLISCL